MASSAVGGAGGSALFSLLATLATPPHHPPLASICQCSEDAFGGLPSRSALFLAFTAGLLFGPTCDIIAALRRLWARLSREVDRLLASDLPGSLRRSATLTLQRIQ